MQLHEFPDQYNEAEPYGEGQPVLYLTSASPQVIAVGIIASPVRHYVPTYRFADQFGELRKRGAYDLPPASPANIAYLASECRRSYDRRYAEYEPTPSIYEPATDCPL